jgi:hypothetical protein
MYDSEILCGYKAPKNMGHEISVCVSVDGDSCLWRKLDIH